MKTFTIINVAAFALLGCIGGQSRGYPLYPATDPPRRQEEVAELTGYVSLVDGQDVSSHGASFELLPGCHLVATPSEWGRFESSGGVIVKTGHLTFALPMKAGRRYLVDVEVRTMGGSTGTAVVEATEKDINGNTTQMFGPVTSTEVVEACKQGQSRSVR